MTWIVIPAHLDALEIGAGILGTGGGGNPYLGKLIARKFVEEGAQVAIVDPNEVPDDAVVASVGGMGSPTVSIERLRRADESVKALRALEAHIGKRVTHLVPSEIGGSNSTVPMVVAAQVGLPVIDGDGMGRAFPELQMETFTMYGVTPTPAALCNHLGHIAIFNRIDDATTLERYARAVTIQMGGSAGYAFPVMTGSQLKKTVIAGTLSLAIRLGEAVMSARREKTDPVVAVCEVTGGQRLFAGKVTDVERRMTGGFARGVVVMEGFGNDAGRTLRVDFQNENLIARDDAGAVLAVVPDLICLIDSDTGAPLTTEVLRYGLRATVIGIPAPEELRTEVGLRFVGPAAFGYEDVTYTPLRGSYANREQTCNRYSG
ncbi:MAG TPA: DUF917 domain-containing protein [Thermomicrobiales bacterium]|nr:DUF917 domain-containing protein [Thermomicrobiales bacterium]